MNDMNKWFYSLTLNELHEYVSRLENENEKLIKELNKSTKMNNILENIARSCQFGYSILRRIEINKNCECNEHLNYPLRKTLNESITDTNVLLNHLHEFQECENKSENLTLNNHKQIPEFGQRVLHPNQSFIPICVQNSLEDKEFSNSRPSSSGYESNTSIGDTVFQNRYSPCSPPSIQSSTQDIPQNLSKRQNPTLNPNPVFHTIEKPMNSFTISNNHLPHKCMECELSFNLKPSLDKHLMTHVTKTVNIQRVGRLGRGRPPKNESRILKVTDSETNILKMNESFGSLPESLISFSALDELKKTKYSGYGRYRCPWPDCGYTPHFLRDLRRHMFKHTGDKKYKCNSEGCEFITVWKTSLLQHQRKKHKLK